MCVIAVCDKRVLTALEVSKAVSGNPDGIGIAWRSGGGLVYHKGISVDRLNKFLDSGIPLPLVVHFRIATSGRVADEMCHPFECASVSLRKNGKTRNELLFHNGVFSSWESLMVSLLPEVVRRHGKLPSGEWNDSRAIALAVGMLGTQVLQFIHGKFAIMKQDGTVNMYGNFKNEDGVWLSSPLTNYYCGQDLQDTIVRLYGKQARGTYGVYGDDDWDDDLLPREVAEAIAENKIKIAADSLGGV